jgi:hypothetical protein
MLTKHIDIEGLSCEKYKSSRIDSFLQRHIPRSSFKSVPIPLSLKYFSWDIDFCLVINIPLLFCQTTLPILISILEPSLVDIFIILQVSFFVMNVTILKLP